MVGPAADLPGERGGIAAAFDCLREPVERIIARATAITSGDPVPEPYATYALDIAEAARHLHALLDKFSAHEHRRACRDGMVDLLALVRLAAAMLAPEASRRGIFIKLAPVDPGVEVAGDPGSVRQILLNLIGNAVRYAPPGSTVCIAVAHRRGGQAVTVADEGPGLLPDEQLRIFDMFERLGRSDDGGSGLGLTIARRLARSMGGDLSVESTAGVGSRFTLELPSP